MLKVIWCLRLDPVQGTINMATTATRSTHSSLRERGARHLLVISQQAKFIEGNFNYDSVEGMQDNWKLNGRMTPTGVRITHQGPNYDTPSSPRTSSRQMVGERHRCSTRPAVRCHRPRVRSQIASPSIPGRGVARPNTHGLVAPSFRIPAPDERHHQPDCGIAKPTTRGPQCLRPRIGAGQ
jgi:hypothetical protein